MENRDQLDRLFAQAVGAIDKGDLPALRRILNEHPEVVAQRLESPGAWLRDQIDGALDGFFAKPYLLSFIAEDPVRTGRVPSNIVEMAQLIVEAARQHAPTSIQLQLEETLRLVAWSGVAAECGAQLPLIDLLVRAGAAPAKNANNALVNGHVDAARRLIELGGHLTLAAALCLDRWNEIPGLFADATDEQKQFALVLAALNGKARGVRWMLDAGVPANKPSADLYSHGTPLHHAVCSGSLETVTALVEGGADMRIADTAWNATPLGWAEHYVENANPERRTSYVAIVEYLRAK